jgi:O-antigen ligase
MIEKLFSTGAIYKWILFFLVAGMASFGRQFAYLGLENRIDLPIYVTEIVLAITIYLGFIGICASSNIRERLKTPINGALAAYWLWGTILLVWTILTYKFDAIRDFVVVYYSLFIFITLIALLNLDDIRHFLFVMVAANLINVFMVFQHFFKGDFRAQGIYLRLGGTSLGLYSIIGFLIVLTLNLVNTKRKQRSWWMIILLPFFLVGILAPQSRSLILDFSGALLVLFLILPKWDKSKLVKIICIILFLTVILIGILPNGIVVAIDQLPKYFQFFNPQEGSNAARLINYNKALDAIVASPFTGVGFGTPHFFYYWGEEPVRSPHNSYLGIAFRSGIVGLIFFLIFLIKFYVYAIKNIGQIKDLQLRGYAAAILAAQIAVSIQALFNVSLEGPHEGVIFWILIGVELRILQLAKSSNIDVIQPS